MWRVDDKGVTPKGLLHRITEILYRCPAPPVIDTG
jgi:hypothetical protein